MSINDYYEMLRRFDWQADFSDDQAVWRKAHQDRLKLAHMATELGGEFERMYLEFIRGRMSGTIPAAPDHAQ